MRCMSTIGANDINRKICANMPSAQDLLRGPLVVAPIYDGLCTFEFSIVAEVFALARPEMGVEWYRFTSAAIEPGPLRAQGGLQVQTTGGSELLDKADLIVIPGWKGKDVAVPPALCAQLRRAWERGATLASICSGAFVLAATGLLDGRRAATHWRYAQALKAQFPAIDVDDKVLYTGAERLFTSAGSAAGIDLMLHLVRMDFGVAAANSVARRMVVPSHRNGGQAQFIERPVAHDAAGKLAELLDTIRTNLHEVWSVERMATMVAMSKRTFLRRFADATGAVPSEWLAQARMDEARRLLETSAHSIETIAYQVGYRSAQVMRNHFRAGLGVSPKEYRASLIRV